MISGAMRRSCSLRSPAASIAGVSARARAIQWGTLSGLRRDADPWRKLSRGHAASNGGADSTGEIRNRPIGIGFVSGIAAFALASDAGFAQNAFPTKTVRIVVPYPAGGGTDVLGRIIADQLSRKWGQTVLVENIGGAAGNIGANDVFRAAPDGHTLLVTSPGPVATNKFLYKEMPFDSTRWTPIALLATGPYVLTMRKSFEGSTIKDLIAAAKANPGKITVGDAGDRFGRPSRHRRA